MLEAQSATDTAVTIIDLHEEIEALDNEEMEQAAEPRGVAETGSKIETSDLQNLERVIRNQPVLTDYEETQVTERKWYGETLTFQRHVTSQIFYRSSYKHIPENPNTQDSHLYNLPIQVLTNTSEPPTEAPPLQPMYTETPQPVVVPTQPVAEPTTEMEPAINLASDREIPEPVPLDEHIEQTREPETAEMEPTVNLASERQKPESQDECIDDSEESTVPQVTNLANVNKVSKATREINDWYGETLTFKRTFSKRAPVTTNKRYYVDLDEPEEHKRDICWWHLRGICKFGDDCYHYHPPPFSSEAQYAWAY